MRWSIVLKEVEKGYQLALEKGYTAIKVSRELRRHYLGFLEAVDSEQLKEKGWSLLRYPNKDGYPLIPADSDWWSSEEGKVRNAQRT